MLYVKERLKRKYKGLAITWWQLYKQKAEIFSGTFEKLPFKELRADRTLLGEKFILEGKL